MKTEAKKKNIVGIIVTVLIAAFFVTAVVVSSGKYRSQSVDETLTSEKQLARSDGEGEGYYVPEESRTVLLKNGDGTYDLTPAVIKWSFGSPVVSLKNAAQILGIDAPDQLSRGTMFRPQVEILPESESLSENFQILFLHGSKGTVKYTTDSYYAEDGDGNFVQTSYLTENNGDDDLMILVDLLPYVKGGEITLGRTVIVGTDTEGNYIVTLYANEGNDND